MDQKANAICQRLGRDLAELFVRKLVANTRAQAVGAIAADATRVEANLVVLYFWTCAWQVAELLPAEVSAPVLNSPT